MTTLHIASTLLLRTAAGGYHPHPEGFDRPGDGADHDGQGWFLLIVGQVTRFSLTR